MPQGNRTNCLVPARALLPLVFAVCTACQVGSDGRLTGLGAAATQSGALAPTAGDIDDGMVRAPELFQASGVAEWNGQRTARGVWVAHPRASSPRRARIVRPDTGHQIDAMLYSTDRTSGGDVITVSSDAAAALELSIEEPVRLAVYGLRPVGATTPTQRREAAQAAEAELAGRVLRLADHELLQLVSAIMRGMGYATVYEDGPPGSALSSIRAFPRPDAGMELPSVRVVVRPHRLGPIGQKDFAAVTTWLDGSGDLGLLVSMGGLTPAANNRASAVRGLDIMDMPGLLHIWQARYEAISPPDRAILPLEPVYFLAGG